MATLKVSNSYPHKKSSAVNMLIRSITETSKEKVLTFAHAAISYATHYTPKYSGYATSGWTFNQGWSPSIAYAVEGSNNGLVYEEGIWDDYADKLNKEVVEENMEYARQLVDMQAERRTRIRLTLMNRVDYSVKWLDKNNTPRLREVNEDYYTFEDILNAAYEKYLDVSKSKRW